MTKNSWTVWKKILWLLHLTETPDHRQIYTCTQLSTHFCGGDGTHHPSRAELHFSAWQNHTGGEKWPNSAHRYITWVDGIIPEMNLYCFKTFFFLSLKMICVSLCENAATEGIQNQHLQTVWSGQIIRLSSPLWNSIFVCTANILLSSHKPYPLCISRLLGMFSLQDCRDTIPQQPYVSSTKVTHECVSCAPESKC